MIMNKVNLEPFHSQKNDILFKDVPLTPKVTSKKRQNITNINKLRINKQQISDFQQTIHFDDTLVRDNNKDLSARQKIIEKNSPKKKCFSQIFNVKVIDGFKGFSRRRQMFEHHLRKDSNKTIEGHLQFEPFREAKVEGKQADKNKRNYTSYSSRRKYRTIKQQSGFFSQRAQSNQGIRNQSTLISKVNPQCVPKQMLQQNPQSMTIQKLQGRNKYFWMMQKVDPKSVLAKQKQTDSKRVNYYQYSIIRPDQIKSLTLLQRQEEKEMMEKRRRQQKVLYLQMLHQMKKKQELQKRNAKMKEEISRSTRKKTTQKKNIDYISQNKKKVVYNQQKNDFKDEFRPWDVQQNGPNNNFGDII